MGMVSFLNGEGAIPGNIPVLWIYRAVIIRSQRDTSYFDTLLMIRYMPIILTKQGMNDQISGINSHALLMSCTPMLGKMKQTTSMIISSLFIDNHLLFRMCEDLLAKIAIRVHYDNLTIYCALITSTKAKFKVRVIVKVKHNDRDSFFFHAKFD